MVVGRVISLKIQETYQMDKKDIKISNGNDIKAFLKKAATLPALKKGQSAGRLLFAMDATASREATWDQACHIQANMFTQTAALGGLDVQLCFYRGFSDFHYSQWFSDSGELLKMMRTVDCVGGHTQIKRVLHHAIVETQKHKINALVFVGDCVEENPDDLCQQAGQLALFGVPIFLFHEGKDANAARCFKQMATISNGAYHTFDAGSAQYLQDLLSAVAVYAVGGQAALEDFNQDKGRVVLRLSGDKCEP